jgi:hypothetical protein
VNCTQCGGATGVVDSRRTSPGLCRRRRKCHKCGYLFSTVEMPKGQYDESLEARKFLLSLIEFANQFDKEDAS